jgi:hypothetical protein
MDDLEPHISTSPFAPVPLEAVTDNIGAKMTALVARGAPRDFVDVARIANAKLATVPELWDLYKAKNPTGNVEIAQSHVRQHLRAIELRRPLSHMNEHDRAIAEATRSWFKHSLLRPNDNVRSKPLGTKNTTSVSPPPKHTPGTHPIDIDYRVYPDLEEPPEHLVTEAERADYVMRVCGAWDFGIMPTPATFTLFADWREVFDKFTLPASPAYHAFRDTYGWPEVETLQSAHYRFDDDLSLV